MTTKHGNGYKDHSPLGGVGNYIHIRNTDVGEDMKEAWWRHGEKHQHDEAVCVYVSPICCVS